jgi:hypothetical protein
MMQAAYAKVTPHVIASRAKCAACRTLHNPAPAASACLTILSASSLSGDSEDDLVAGPNLNAEQLKLPAATSLVMHILGCLTADQVWTSKCDATVRLVLMHTHMA